MSFYSCWIRLNTPKGGLLNASGGIHRDWILNVVKHYRHVDVELIGDAGQFAHACNVRSQKI